MGHSDLLSLAIPSWVGTMSTGYGFGHRWGRNGEFCVAVGPLSGGLHAYWLLYASSIGSKPRRLKGKGVISLASDLMVYG